MTDAPEADLHGRPDPDVLAGLSASDPLALAEACARTLGAAAAVTRRLLPAADLEPTLDAAYRHLWASPPGPDQPLEGWMRARCFALGLQRLEARGEAPVAPSVRAAAAHLPPGEPAYVEATERAIEALDDAARRAVVRAHDGGVSSAAQGDPRAADALLRGLLALAGCDSATVPEGVDPRVADLSLGLLGPREAGAVAAALRALDDEPVAELLRALRRAKRRLEGLPPTADVGLRIVARLVGGTPPLGTGAPAPARAGAEEAASPVVDDDGGAAPAPPIRTPTAPALERAPAPRQADAETAERADAAPPRSRGRRVAAFLAGLVLVAVGVALGLFVVGPLLVDWLDALLN